jgi:hypothetical protein
MKRRDQSETEIVPESSLIARLQTEIRALQDAILSKVVDIPFR